MIDLMERPAVRWADGPDWRGAAVVILASGPSLSTAQTDRVLCWRSEGSDRRVIAINTTFLLAPWADLLYACDAKWWDLHIDDVRAVDACSGAYWSIQAEAGTRHGVRVVQSAREAGLGRKPGVINQGMNSGYQAINLAWQCGAARIVLLGYDMHDSGGRSHWHADHPHKIRRANPYVDWLLKFPALARDLAAERCAVVNCTPHSALRSFPVSSLDEALSHD